MTKQAACPSVNLRLCKKCKICINICPKKVLEPDENGLPHVIYPNKCTACGLCTAHCPDFAIEIVPPPGAGSGEDYTE
mgnify:CR=1 FL=1